MEDPRVVILLATYNRANIILETLNSIVAQTFKEWECIIVDDHSEDNTFEVLQQFCNADPRFSYYLKTNKYQNGLSGTRNYGLDLAKNRSSDFIQFFDDDDLMHPQKLELQIVPFIKNPNLNFSVCKFEKLVQNGKSWKIEKQELQLDFLHLGDAILTGEMKMNSLGPLWRNDFIQNYRFDEHLKYAEEWELYTRIGYEHPNNYEVVNDALFQYRKHNKTLTLGDDPNFERKKTSAIIRIKILEYLSEHRLHTKKSILFLANTFLLYSYYPNLVKDLRLYVKNNNGFSRQLLLFLDIGLIIGKYYRKTLRRMALWV